MTTKALCEQFSWSPESEWRNELTSYYEPVQPFLLLALARRLRDAVFIDAGANIGFYTVVMGAEPSVIDVHAFEPMPEAASAVRWNVRANLDGKSARVRQLALSDHCGDLEFAVVGPLAGDNGALQDTPHDRGRIDVHRVPCSRIDDEVRASGRALLLKIDVEGHELSLLRGATRTLVENRGFMQIEIHESPSRPHTITLLENLGWHQVARVGSDYYFSNMPETGGDTFRAEIFEEAMGILVDCSKSDRRASRRRIAPGIYLEVARSTVDRIKGVLRR